ncbi:MAG: hypothetical protein JST11_13810 [Acidobacteria bacterium]|nr:hypothetical protein [Acidobacteriota bacterium]
MQVSTRGPQYLAARTAAERVHPRFREVRTIGAALPEIDEIERLIDAAFWASLRREEDLSPQISLAFLAPEDAGALLRFESALALTPEALSRLAPAAEHPGIHLGVWRENGELRVWGATRSIPAFCFVLEVVAPGLVVLKYRRSDATAKFVNVAVLEGDAVKVVDRCSPAVPGIGSGIALLELAASMRRHKRGGALLVVPAGSDAWRESIRHPIAYSVAPRFARLAELIAEPEAAHQDRRWQEAFRQTVESIAGLTAVDGATIVNDRFEVLAFGAKIRRRDGSPTLENVILSAPLEGFEAHVLPTLQTGGTRHLSAAQFAHDQRDSLALVASQDGRFTVFAWSELDAMVRAHRVETLLM